jgi:hypothetical protein
VTDEQIARNLAPLASGVHVRPSEDTLPELTARQEDTKRFMDDAYDAVELDRILPDGRAWLTTYRDDEIRHVELGRDGIPT